MGPAALRTAAGAAARPTCAVAQRPVARPELAETSTTAAAASSAVAAVSRPIPASATAVPACPSSSAISRSATPSPTAAAAPSLAASVCRVRSATRQATASARSTRAPEASGALSDEDDLKSQELGPGATDGGLRGLDEATVDSERRRLAERQVVTRGDVLLEQPAQDRRGRLHRSTECSAGRRHADRNTRAGLPGTFG